MVHRRLLKGFQIMNEIEPGTCPNFYLWGESVSKLEADAKELTAMMEMDKVIRKRQIIMRLDTRLLQPFASWSNSL